MVEPLGRCRDGEGARALRQPVTAWGSHYWHTPKAGGKVDKGKPTQFGRAMGALGIEMIAAYSPQARAGASGCSGRFRGAYRRSWRGRGSPTWTRPTSS